MHDGAYCKFDNFAAFRPRNIANSDDLCRDMPWSRIASNDGPNLIAQLIVKNDVWPQHDEQDNSHIVIPVLTDSDTLYDLAELLDLPIDLGRTNADATWIKYGIGTSVDDQSFIGAQFGEISMRPDARESFEVRRLDIANDLRHSKN